MSYQVVEKDDYGTDWAQVRYQAYAMERFDTREEAVAAAQRYLTELNCNNALTKDQKLSGAEAFMLEADAEGKVTGCFMGILDGEKWYLTDRQGKPITERSYFELEGKAEVAVREVPGT
ncbi:MAG: hypothetical protein ACXAC5_01160 [Promethearchaeota archaeon]|jgi:hypothetical protein